MKHIAIIGAGVVGLCVAYYAFRHGFRVTVLEQKGSQRDGTSYGNAGMVVPSHFVPLAAPGMVEMGLRWMWNPESPFYVKPRLDWNLLRWAWLFYKASSAAQVATSAPVLRDLSLASRECHQQLAEELGNNYCFEQKGLLMLCNSEHGLEEEAKTAKLAGELGIPAKVLSAEETKQLEPCLQMNIVGAVHFPLDCHMSPSHFMHSLQKNLEASGVEFLWNTELKGWKFSNRKVEALNTNNRELIADEYVLCGGTWSPQLLTDLKLSFPIQAGKGYSLTLEQPKKKPNIPAILTEARVAVTPIGNRLRFGGTMEIAGLVEGVNPRRIKGIKDSVMRYYPEFTPQDFADISPWYGLRPCSPDGLPYVGRFGGYQNLSTACGHAMMGLSLAPITGKLMAELLQGQPTSISLQALSPDRYA